MGAEPAVRADTANPVPDVAATVRGILARYGRRPLDEVRPDARLEHDLELDSFAMIEITLALQEAFPSSMGDVTDPLELNLVTVDDLINYVNSRVAAPRPAEASDDRPHSRRE